MSHDEDFFGVEYVSKQPIPEHLLPQSAMSKSVRQKKFDDSKQESSDGYIDSAFFPELMNVEKMDEELFAPDARQPFSAAEGNRRKRSTFVEEDDNFFTKVFCDNSQSVAPVKVAEADGLKKILGHMDHIWKYSEEELIHYMANRVVFQSDDLIAFDKPYGMPYSGSSKQNALQFDRILNKLKRIVAPKCDRLYLVSSLDKYCSGVIIFAKNVEKQKHWKGLIEGKHALFRFRCLVKNVPDDERIRIAVPLIKVVKDQDYKLCPVKGVSAIHEKIYHLETDCHVINQNYSSYTAVVDALVTQGMPHLVRSHLYYGINCPVVGDLKYMRREQHSSSTFAQRPRISDEFMNVLGIRRNDVRKLPLFMHLSEVRLPQTATSTVKISTIRTEIPSFFSYVLKRLKLLRR